MTSCLNASYYLSVASNETFPLGSLDNFCVKYFPPRDVPVRLLLETKVFPVIICMILVTNVSICIVLTKKHMITPTNVILFCMATADMLTGLSPLPIYVLKSFDYYIQNRSVLIGYVVYLFSVYLPTVFHMASIWLTVVLAVQRFVYITFPTSVKRVCTIRNSVITCVLVYVASFLCHCQLLTSTFSLYTKVCHIGATEVESGTHQQEPEILESTEVMKCNWSGPTPMLVYYWFRTALMHVLPCTALTLFTILLIMAMHHAARKRQKLLAGCGGPAGDTGASNKAKKKHGKEQRRSRDASATSQMLLVVVALFLLVELPNGIIVTMYTFHKMLHIEFALIPGSMWGKMGMVCNIAILISYPINFFVYCAMSRQFRDTFKSLVGRKSTAQETAERPSFTKSEASHYILMKQAKLKGVRAGTADGARGMDRENVRNCLTVFYDQDDRSRRSSTLSDKSLD